MATAEQLKALIKAHFSDDQERFYTSALQIAAHEAGQGHGALSQEIRLIVDQARKDRGASVIPFPRDMQGLVLAEHSDLPASALVIPPDRAVRIQRVIAEFEQQAKLKRHGLAPRRKILLAGPPGTGKTMTARVLAHEVQLPLFTIQVDRLTTKFMGETSAKLRQLFDLIQEQQGVYLFDEFDAIGGERTFENDVGEMRRVLNAFLQFIEQDTSDSLIVAATNSAELLDKALFRRFDDVLYYTEPGDEERRNLIQNVLGTFKPARLSWKDVLSVSDGLSHSEIDKACRDAIKHAVLADRAKVTVDELKGALTDRQLASAGKKRG